MLLYVHASGSSGGQWKRWQRELPGDAPDLIGSGAEPAWTGPFSIQMDVDRLIARCKEPVDVIGHSYGGVLALYLALQRPDLVRGVAVYEPPLLSLIDDPALLELLPPEAGAGEEAWLRTFVDWWNGPGAWDALPAPVRAEFVRVGPKVAGEVRGLREDRLTLGDYARLQAPVLLMSGDRTPRPVARGLDRLSELPGVRRIRLTDAGHMAPVQAPERLVPLVREFLGNLPPARA